MGRLQKSTVYAADAGALGEMAKPLREAATGLVDAVGRVHTVVYDFDWQGQAKQAADERADREVTQDLTVAAALNALADDYENAKNTMAPMIDGLKTKAQGLEDDGFTVSQDWVVTDALNYDLARRLAPLFGISAADVDKLQTGRANEAATETVNLQRLADELTTADTDTAAAITAAKDALYGADGPRLVLPGLAPGQVVNLGPVAGTDNPNAIPGIRASDLGEVIQLPNGQYVAIFGDSYSEPQVGPPGDPRNTHYPSVAVPVTFDAQGRPHFGTPLTGPDGTNVLFPLPRRAIAAGANNALPAGTITLRDGTTYMMVVGTNTNGGLNPVGGSWLVKVTNDPAGGWSPIEPPPGSTARIPDTYQPWSPNANPGPGHASVGTRTDSPPTQISGYQGSDGNVYIAADAFDRSQGVTMYRVDPEHITDRGAWQPWTGSGWGNPGEAATPLTPPGQNWGEISLREVDGQGVLSGTNFNDNTTKIPTVEVHVGDSPTSVIGSGPPTVVMSNDPTSPNFVPAPYGGYILPGSTLDNLGIFGSQWYQPTDAQGNPTGPVQYDVQETRVNVEPGQR